MTCTLPFLDKQKISGFHRRSSRLEEGKYSRSVRNYVNRLSVRPPEYHFPPPCPSVSICLRCPKEHLQTAIRSYPDCDFNLRREATSRSVRPVCATYRSTRLAKVSCLESNISGRSTLLKYKRI